MQILLNKKPLKLLITGPPGCGKTTLIKEIYSELESLKPAGFYTEEIRENGKRRGFRIKTFDGMEGILAHVETKSRYRVSKYGVDIVSFEKILMGIDFFDSEHKIVIIDEIGKMECFSNYFKNLILKLFDGKKPIISTIALKGDSFIEGLKKRKDVICYNISKEIVDIKKLKERVIS